MRLLFAGTPEVAVPSLRRLADGDHEVAAVLTRPDAPVGRKRVLTPSPVAAAAAELGLPTVRAERLRGEVLMELETIAPDLGVVVAYGALLGPRSLAVPRLGWINLHFSLLPRWRGAAPVQWSLIAGDPEVGASVFQLVPELDAGDVYAEARTPTPPTATAGELLAELADRGAALLAEVVDTIGSGTARATPQRGEVTLAPKLGLEDGVIDWRASAREVVDRFRGVTPEPGAHTLVAGGRLKLLGIAPGDASIELAPGEIRLAGQQLFAGTGTTPVLLQRVQPAGRGAMAAADWYRGLRDDRVELGR